MAEAVQLYVEKIRKVYAVIATQIEDLLFVLNEVGEKDKDTIKLANSINEYLSRLEKSVLAENVIARNLSAERKKKFLEIMQRELQEIKLLKAYIGLSQKKQKPEIIRKIHELYKSVEQEIKNQEALAA